MARRGVTGALLVGGASRRFGSPKALARIDGETLAERAHRTLAEAFENVIVVGKADDALALPFPVLDDGDELRAAIVGVAASLRHAPDDVVVCLPTDMPFVSPQLLRELADAATTSPVAIPDTGPLPGAYRRAALPVLERRIAERRLTLRAAADELGAIVVPADPHELRNVNTVEDLVA